MIPMLLLLAPLLASEPELGVVFFGDSGTGGPGQARVAAVVAEHCSQERCDLLLLLGDNLMPDGASGPDDPRWAAMVEEPYGHLGLTIRPVLGNHDHRGDPWAQVTRSARSSLWDMPAGYYAFEAGPAAFFALDTPAMDRRQRRWLARGLRRCEAPWVIVYGHHPLRSGGAHGPEAALQRRIGRIVERRADLYLSGHDHHQEVVREAEGPTWVVMGSGGSPPRPVQPGTHSRYAASRRGFGYLLLTEHSAELWVVEASGVTRYRESLERE